MNKWIGIARLTKDANVGTSQNGTMFASFSIAVNRRFKREGEPEADFFVCTAFGKQAEFIDKYVKKGTKVALSGTLQNDNYTNKEGQKVYGIKIIVDEIEFAESKGESKPKEEKPDDDFMSINEAELDTLPFN